MFNIQDQNYAKRTIKIFTFTIIIFLITLTLAIIFSPSLETFKNMTNGQHENISQTDFEVGNSIYLNILVKDIEEKSQNISQKFIVNQLEEQPWNAKEMTIKDPDGHLITLTQSNISDTDFEKLMKQTSKEY